MTQPVRIEITERIPFADGAEFGDAGPYERLSGRAWYAVDPSAPAQAGVVDIDRAPRNADGLVEFAADVMILKPVDMARGNRRLFFGYGNRGNKRELQFFNDAPPTNDPKTLAHAGNGYLFRRGYSIVWGAWEGDLLPGNGRLILDVPVATDGDRPITGPVRIEIIAEKPGTTVFPLSGRASTRSFPTMSLDTGKATLTRRRYQGDARIAIPASEWAFARVEGGSGLDNQGAEQAIIPSDIHVHLPASFQPGWIYELVYTARDPRVHGLGHVAVRDLVSFLKQESGTANPLAGGIDKAYAWGRSQTGRCIRDFLYQGYNEDAAGRQVFEGVLPHVAGAGLMWMNHRFSLVVSPAGQQYEDHATMADRFPFSYARSIDPHSGREDAILKRPGTDPLVLHTQSAIEYWQRRGSLVHTDAHGNDLEQPENVRVYLWSSSQHFADPNVKRPAKGVCQQYLNIVQTSMLFRAMLDALDRWATDGTPPPASRIPRRADGTLVTAEEWRRRFPAIPGVALPTGVNACPLLDFGPRAAAGIIDQEPPAVLAAEGYPTLVPAVDADGNDIAGVRAPMVSAPLGTYTGWNIRDRAHGHGAMHEFTGSYIPFPDTDEERAGTGDPRPSLMERYGSPEAYAAAIEAAARQLVADGLMLEEDVARSVKAAADWGRPLHDVRL